MRGSLMAVVGYARVSSGSQSLAVQQDQLTAAGCKKVFSETQSGNSQDHRAELIRALDYVREGDQFVVTRIDRLARSVTDLHDIVARLTAKGVGFRSLQQGEFDTTTATGRLFLSILGAIAEFETGLRRERQAEGIARAKARGAYRGRPATVDKAEVRRLRAEGVAAREIARRLRIAPSTVYLALKDAPA